MPYFVTRFVAGLSFVTFSIITSTLLSAQGDFFAESNQALQEGNRLLAVELLRDGLKQMPNMPNLINQYLPLISDYSATTPYSQTQVGKVRNKAYFERLQQHLEDTERLDALQAIADLARDRQVVILNEAHDSPQHRAFGLMLALELRKMGFEFLAVETLAGPDGKSGPMKFEYPTLETGYYSDEPVFGDFLRQANRSGYQMIAYEIEPGQRKVNAQQDPNASIKERENAQSHNLIKHVLGKHKDAKLFIFVGYSHATEDWQTLEDGSQLGWMAAQIKKKTGIDPLTIDQVGGSYNPKSKSVDSVFKLVQSQAPMKQSSILKDGAGDWVVSDSYYQKIDLTVFHPVQKMIDGRPDWLRMNGYRIPFEIQNKDYFVKPTTMVQAYHESEGSDSLPVDQLLLDSSEGTSTLLLPEGKYRTEIRTIDGTVEKGPTIEVTR